jgi:nitrate reductase cytochrome c-type subunit
MKKAILVLSAISLMIIGSNCGTGTDKKKAVASQTTDKVQIKTPLEEGKEMALKTKAELGRFLMEAIREKGTAGAVEFCSTRAIRITDSMSTALGSHLKRVAEFNRNPVNIVTPDELSYIQQVKAALAAKENPKPRLTENSETIKGYYPILTESLCLQCHGDKKTEIEPATLAAINRFYPNDKATGFKLNQLRGIWVVEMKKSK